MFKHELKNLLQSTGKEANGNLIQAIAHYLRSCKETGSATKGREYDKDQETKSLIEYIEANGLWYDSIVNESNKIGEGAEQKVYYYPESGKVIKLNDSPYFLLWLDYFYNLLLHNYYFPATGYELKGFIKRKDVLHAVVEQVYVKATEPLDIESVRRFLMNKGFANIRNMDFEHKEWGIILEDLHDENVLQSEGVLFFIDTVFYITKDH